METPFNFLYWCCVTFLSSTCLVFIHQLIKPKKLPPGPRRWPIIGNILDFGSVPHNDLYNLRDKYGPVLLLKLGSLNTLVIQSAKVAEQLFKHHDFSFSNRMVPDALRAHNFHKGSMSFGQNGPNWRMLRRIVTTELMTNRRINEARGPRRKCLDAMIKSIEEDTTAKRARGESGKINLINHLFVLLFNIFGNLIFSRDLLDPQAKEGKELYDALLNIEIWAAKPNVSDFFPMFGWLDPQGIRRNMTHDMGKAMKIISRFVKERIDEKKSGLREKISATMDFLDVLLEFENGTQEEKITSNNIYIFVLYPLIFNTKICATNVDPGNVHGWDRTSSSTVEWAIAELIRRQESMKMAKEEIDRVIGCKRKVEESDINDLPYLQAVVKETLRLHPGSPLLVPRSALEDTNFMGYHISKDTQVLVNAWAIGRDPQSWGDDALCFKPERFIGSNIDYKGHNFELLPFGAGRRMCPGLPLAHRVVNLVLASLLQYFDWKLDHDFDPKDIDMSEGVGITLRKNVPLELVPIKRFV